MADDKEQGLQGKDVLIAFPIFASSLAIAWQVGRFWRVGGFYFFSFSDHLVAASAYLPFAFIGILFFAGVGYTVASAGKLTTYRPPILLQSVLIYTIAAGVLVAHKTGLIESGFVLLLVIIAITYSFNIVFFNFTLRSPTGLCWCFGSLVFLTFAASLDLIDFNLRHLGDAETRISVVTTKIASVQGVLLMAGEKGMLLYRPDLKQVTYLRIDETRSVDWPY